MARKANTSTSRGHMVKNTANHRAISINSVTTVEPETDVKNEQKPTATQPSKDKKQNKNKSKNKKKGNSKAGNKLNANNKRPRDQEGEKEIKPEVEAKKRKKAEDAAKLAQQRIEEFVEATDVILVVMDARDPERCRSKQLERLIQDKTEKKIVFVLSKIDLVPRRNAEGWIKALSQEYPTVAIMDSDKSTLTGADQLAKLLTHYAISTKKASILVGAIGYPSVGRASVIQSLKQSLSSNKTKIAVKLNESLVTLTDSKSVSGPIDLLLRSKILTPDALISATVSIVMRCKKELLMLNYALPTYDNGLEFLESLARQQGLVLKGGVPETVAAARFFLRELTSGKMAFYTAPPRSGPILALTSSKSAGEFGFKVKDAVEKLNELEFPLDRTFGLSLAPYISEEYKEEEKEVKDGGKDEQKDE